MREKYLEVPKFPATTLVVARSAITVPTSGQKTSGDAPGTLTLHGQSHPVTVHYESKGDGSGVATHGSFRINMNDFGITVPTYLRRNREAGSRRHGGFQVGGKLISPDVGADGEEPPSRPGSHSPGASLALFVTTRWRSRSSFVVESSQRGDWCPGRVPCADGCSGRSSRPAADDANESDGKAACRATRESTPSGQHRESRMFRRIGSEGRDD